MTTPNTTPSPFNLLWWNKPQGLNELNSAIQYINHPVLIMDRSKGVVWGANSSYLKQSEFDLKDILGQPIISILNDLNLSQALQGAQVSGSLKRRTREAVKVAVSIKPVEGNNQTVLVLIDPEQYTKQTASDFQNLLTKALIKISALTLEGDLEHELKFICAMIRQTYDASNVCIYQGDPEYPRLNKLVESGEMPVFSQTISSSDLIRLSKVNVWMPGKRMTVEIFHTGRANHMEYVASVPLGQAGKLFGLLVIGDQKEPTQRIADYLEVIGATLTRYFENRIYTENLNRQIVEEKKSLVVTKAVMDNAREGILFVSAAMDLIEMNPAAEWMLGYADWEVKGKPVESVLIGPESLVPALAAASQGIPTHNIGNVSLHRRNGQSFPAHIQTIPVGKSGEVTSMVVFISDVSENEEIRIRTQQLEQRAILGEVTAVFAHEVRNPINNIYTGLQVLAATSQPDDPNQETLVHLQNDCMRLNHLMDSVLNFSRNTQYKYEPVDLKMLLQRMLERWRPRFAKVNVNAFFQAEDRVPNVLGDSKALEQVFTNLISNAVDAMSKNGGTLAVKITGRNSLPNRSQVVVTVSDNGPGIPDEIRERIFEPFVTTKSHGTGLGLAITKRIVTAHRGSIQLNSFPGGTMFEVTLLAFVGEES
jgi:two-component system, NtrC family, sensor histidine kinase AtoS